MVGDPGIHIILHLAEKNLLKHNREALFTAKSQDSHSILTVLKFIIIA